MNKTRWVVAGAFVGVAIILVLGADVTTKMFDQTYFSTNQTAISLHGNLTNWSKASTNLASFNGVTNTLGVTTTGLALMQSSNYFAARSFLELYPNRVASVSLRDAWSPQNGRSSANQIGTSSLGITVYTNCYDIQISYANIYRASTTIVPNTNPVITKSALIVNGVVYPVYFHGLRSTTLDPGGSVTSDPVPVRLAPSDQIFVHSYWDAGSGGYVPVPLALLGTSSSLVYGYDCITNGVDNVDAPTIGSTVGGEAWGPSNIMGKLEQGVSVSVLLLGDSIMTRTTDAKPIGVYGTNTWLEPWGFATRALTPMNIPFCKLSCGGDQASVFITNAQFRVPSFGWPRYAICEYGANDLGTYASLTNRLMQVWHLLHGRGTKVWQTTITPNTTSTDGWTTTNNQAVKVIEPDRLAVNQWLMSNASTGAMAVANGLLAGVFDVASKVEINGLWNVSAADMLTSGTVTSADATSLTDNLNGAWASHVYDYTFLVKITGGTGSPQTQIGTINITGGTWYVSSWSVEPVAGSTYEIWITPSQDGIHPTASRHAAMATAIDTTKFVWP